MNPQTRSASVNAVHVLFTGILWGISYYCRQSLSVIVDVLETDLKTTPAGVASLSSAILFPFCLMQIPAGSILQIVSPEFSMAIGTVGIGIFSICFGFIHSIATGIIVNIFIGICASFVGLGPFALAEERYGLKYVAFIVSIVQGIGIVVAVSCQYIQSKLYQSTNEWRTMYWYYGAVNMVLGSLYVAFMIFEKQCSSVESNINININSNIVSVDHDNNRHSKNGHVDTCNINIDTELMTKTKKSGECDCNCVHMCLRVWRTVGTNTSELSFGSLTRQMTDAFKIAICKPWNWFLGIYGIFISAITFGLSSLWLIPYLILKFDFDRSIASLINGSYTFAWGFGSVIFGKLVLFNCCRARKLSLLLGCIMEQSLLIVIYLIDNNDNVDVSIIVLLNAVSGLGSSVFLVFMNVVRDYNAKDGVQEVATGMINGFNFIGAIITQLIVGAMLDVFGSNSNSNKNTEYSVDTYNRAFIIFPIFGFLSIILTCVLKETYGEPVDWDKAKTKTQKNVTDTPKNAH